jgi:hypothetical protein
VNAGLGVVLPSSVLRRVAKRRQLGHGQRGNRLSINQTLFHKITLFIAGITSGLFVNCLEMCHNENS